MLIQTGEALIDNAVEKVEQMVAKILKMGEGGIAILKEFEGFASKTVDQVTSVTSVTRRIVKSVTEWTNAEVGVRGVVAILLRIIDEIGLADMVADLLKGNKDFMAFGTKVTNIASKVVKNVMTHVPAAYEYLDMAEKVLQFVDKLDNIDNIFIKVKKSLGFIKSVTVTNPPSWCRSEDDSGKLDLCVTRHIITPEVSIYKKLGFPMEMAFLNMLSTKGMVQDENKQALAYWSGAFI